MADLRMIFGDYRRQQAEQARRAQHAGIVKEALYGQPQTASDGSGMGPPTPGGLLQDPTNLQNQLRFAGALEASPMGGGGLLGNLVMGEQQRGTVGDQLMQSETESQRRARSSDLDRQQRSEYNATQAFLELRRQQQQQGQFEQGLALNQAQQQAAPGFEMGSTPAGYIPRTDEAGNLLGFAPAPGTPDHREALGQGMALRNTVRAFDTFSSKLKTVGTELTGTDVGLYRAMREDLLSQVGTLLEKGVLQKDERAELARVLPDPTTFGQGLFSLDKTTLAAYEWYRNRYMQKLSDWRTINKLLPDNPVALPGPQQ